MKTEKALQKFTRGGIKISQKGSLMRVFQTKYAIMYDEKKDNYILLQPYIGNQRTFKKFESAETLKQYLEKKYHKNQ